MSMIENKIPEKICQDFFQTIRRVLRQSSSRDYVKAVAYDEKGPGEGRDLAEIVEGGRGNGLVTPPPGPQKPLQDLGTDRPLQT
jgi:hypothetical protein